jgi:hypothetical protein
MGPIDLSLTHGQVAWALARGQRPSDQLIDQLRYLRQLEVPFSKAELGAGSGNRIRFGFDQLIELGVAVFGLERGMRPCEIARILVDHRAEFRRLYRDTLAALPEDAFTAEWDSLPPRRRSMGPNSAKASKAQFPQLPGAQAEA